MNTGRRRRRTLLPVLLLVLVAGCGAASEAPQPEAVPTGDRTTLDAAAPNCVVPEKGEPDPNAGKPNRIEIPALGVVARVVPVGLTDGHLVPPSDPQVVGWWKSGSVPGAVKGTAILTGHTVSTGGGVFDDLRDLRRGDQVIIRTSLGEIEYRVVEVTYYPKAELARLSDRLFSQTVPGRLVLSTCSNFDGKAYRGNTLAFAAPSD